MLREEAYVGARLDAQLEEQALRFLSDRTRNRFDPKSGLALSSIFKWYRGDFARGDLARFLAPHAAALGATPQQLAGARIAFLDYDWRLNDAK
jgi:hypothetical protein